MGRSAFATDKSLLPFGLEITNYRQPVSHEISSPAADTLLSMHWRQTQPLLQSNRAGVRCLSHPLWTRREESPGQSKVGGIAAKTSLDQLFVQYKGTVMDDINGYYLHLPLFSLQGFPLYEATQIGRVTTGEPTPLE